MNGGCSSQYRERQKIALDRTGLPDRCRRVLAFAEGLPRVEKPRASVTRRIGACIKQSLSS